LAGELALLVKRKRNKKRRLMKMGKSIWPTIAEFSYSDEKIKYSSPICIRIFYFADRRDPKKMVKYICLKAKSANNLLRVDNILNNNTTCRWREQAFKFGSSVNSYVQTLEEAYRCLNYPNERIKEGITMKLNREITDEMLNEIYKKQQSRKMIRSI
jgi:hypothetical protein